MLQSQNEFCISVLPGKLLHTAGHGVTFLQLSYVRPAPMEAKRMKVPRADLPRATTTHCSLLRGVPASANLSSQAPTIE